MLEYERGGAGAMTPLLLLILIFLPELCMGHQDAEHITAILGSTVVFNCHVEFPEGHPVPYVVQWDKKGVDIPIYIWYENYPQHIGQGFESRIGRVAPNSPFGLASLNLTDIKESDQGWFQCRVTFLDRSPSPGRNGTWYHLDVHAPPRFTVTPEDIIYVNLGDSIILNCQAEGTPTPEILWYKGSDPVEPSPTVAIVNDGTELRISALRSQDMGDYICIARNGEGRIHHTANVIIAGAAVLIVPPHNLTKLEGEKAEFPCEARALPGNVTVRWFRENVPVEQVTTMETRVSIRKDGTLIINPVAADDSGYFSCEVTNGIGDPQIASAYLNVEYPARVTFTPTVQYLPFRLAGMVQCHIRSNPPPQFVTWTKDRRLLDPYIVQGVATMNNGSLLFTRVNESEEGRYTCTPYNVHGTQGPSGQMEVLVRKPPDFLLRPEHMYQKKVGDTVEMPCLAHGADGTTRPAVSWQRQDGRALPRERILYSDGNITIENLKQGDFGVYQCVATNEVATIVTSTQLVVEGTVPHAPYNLSANVSAFAVTLSWLPGYSGGPDYNQNYAIKYSQVGAREKSVIEVTPPGSTQVTIHSLLPATTYEFQVVSKNSIGDGMLSNPIKVATKDITDYRIVVFPTDSTGSTYIPIILRPKGPRPNAPLNVSLEEVYNGYLISWKSLPDESVAVAYYSIDYRTDMATKWLKLNKGQIKAQDRHFLVKTLKGGRSYFFKVYSHTLTNSAASDEFKYDVPPRVKNKAITAGVVGGFLFFVVAIIMSICTVKICNKRKRRKEEKAYNMVACRITDARNGGQPLRGPVPMKKKAKDSLGSEDQV